MSKIIVRDQNVSRYSPMSEFKLTDHIVDSICFKHNTYNVCQYGKHSDFLWLNIEGFFNGTSVHIKPSKELTDLLKSINIYGDAEDKNIYLKVFNRNDGKAFLQMQYQQIIGSYFLTEIDQDEVNNLKKLSVVNFPKGSK